MYSLSLWLALGALGMALGCPWVDFGAHLAPFGCHWAPCGPHGSLGGSLGVPWGSLGVPWGAQADFLRFVENWTSNSEQMCLMYCACAQNLANPPDSIKVAYGPQLVTPLPRAGSKDEVSSKETPSNEVM